MEDVRVQLAIRLESRRTLARLFLAVHKRTHHYAIRVFRNVNLRIQHCLDFSLAARFLRLRSFELEQRRMLRAAFHCLHNQLLIQRSVIRDQQITERRENVSVRIFGRVELVGFVYLLHGPSPIASNLLYLVRGGPSYKHNVSNVSIIRFVTGFIPSKIAVVITSLSKLISFSTTKSRPASSIMAMA